MVRLLLVTMKDLEKEAAVSIPQWCDCCNLKRITIVLQVLVSIPQWCDCCSGTMQPSCYYIMFQSHNGAIAAKGERERLLEFAHVSIPQWCDCCFTSIAVVLLFICVSIPQWCDCCKTIMDDIVAHKSVSIPQWCDCCLGGKLVGVVGWRSFNPTMVRLLPAELVPTPTPSISFNPTMVRLLLAISR